MEEPTTASTAPHADDASVPQQRPRRRPQQSATLLGAWQGSAVSQNAQRVADAMGKAQRLRHEREATAESITAVFKLSPRSRAATVPLPNDSEEEEEGEGAPEEEEEEEEGGVEREATDESEIPDPADTAAQVGEPPQPHAEQHLTKTQRQEIQWLCTARQDALASGNTKLASKLKDELWHYGVVVDDATCTWQSSTESGTWEPRPVAQPPPKKPKQPAVRIKPIDSETYQRLMGGTPMDSVPYQRRQSPDDEAMRYEGERHTARRRSKTHSEGIAPPRLPGASSSPRRSCSPPKELSYYTTPKECPLKASFDSIHFGQTATSAMSTASSSPRLSAIAAMSSGERLYYTGAVREKMKNEKLKSEREAKILEEMSQMASPQITKMAREKVTEDFLSRQQAWLAKRDESIKTAMQQKDAMAELEARRLQQEEFTGPTSKEILNRRQHPYGGPIRDWSARFEHHHLLKTAPKPPPHTFTPCITAAAEHVHRPGKVTDRLHEDAAQRMARRELEEIEAAERELVDPATGQRRFVPCSSTNRSMTSSCQSSTSSLSPQSQTRGGIKFTRSSQKKCPADADAVVNRLLAQGQASKRRNEQRRKDAEAVQEQGYRPRLSRTTQEMVARMVRRPLHEAPSKVSQEGTRCGSVLFVKNAGSSSACTASSYQCSDVSSTADTAKTNNDDFLYRCMMREKMKNARLQRLRKESVEKEMSHCSFVPQVCPESAELVKRAWVKQHDSPSRAPSDNTSDTETTPTRTASGGSAVLDDDALVALQEWRKVSNEVEWICHNEDMG